MTVTQRVLCPWLAVIVTLSALLFATLAGGPLVRALFGVPAGFREDFTSRPAYLQALFVQTFSVGVGFLMFGAAIGTRIKAIRFGQAVWIVNPITVGVGFGVYKWIYRSLQSPDYLPEYDSLSIFALFIIAAPFVFAFCLFAGAYLRGSTWGQLPMSEMAIFRQLTNSPVPSRFAILPVPSDARMLPISELVQY